MARGKKEEELSLEEKLERALVPVEEQPYEVPENWCWVKVGSVCTFENGYAFKSDKFCEKGTTPVIRISNIMQNEVNIDGCVYTTEKDVDNRFLAQYGDLLIAMSGATTGKNGIFLSNIPAYVNQRVGNIKVRNKNVLLPEFRNYYIMEKEQEILQSAYGGAQPNISSKKICDMNMPLPPLLEQKRIVEQIENLFAKLDEAKDKVQVVVDGYEARNASIYHEAFCGKLTEKWRVDNNIKNEWKKLRFDEVADIKSNLVDPSKYLNYPHIAPDNIEKRTGKLLDFHTIEEDGVVSGKHRFHAGQILYSKIRPYLSKVVMVDFDGLCSADMYPIEARGNTRFLWYYMLSDEFLEQASSAGSRSVLPKINQKELSAIEVSITSEEEQAAVVDVLDSILLSVQQAKEAAENVIEQIDFIKQSILAKAFRGELGTNNPNEETSIKLLKQIFEQEGQNET